ncbi:tRNA (adenosine(37)-N6)-dimethylallyltransferase MiaA [Candidatus Saccharibacteria bacterium]|nr:MAG: tRNA (adenosine(37)-N6)-dimethylallyltransferase MiaA [Candidatus Saccharibacteria bacterium]PID98870.1 MAG: tRNA (adenosine(37)-N6)-dimethylallyltransferase MiaA [Candidatus Saccharibacteria bacterium]
MQMSSTNSRSSHVPLVVVLGETASGKSALGLVLARRFGGEIICADSVTVYKGFDIGSAKPGAADRADIPHHVLDVADAATGFSAATFKRHAEQAIADITTRGKLPIMVGGSGLYIDSVLYDYQFNPSSNSSERDVLNTMTAAELLFLAKRRGLDTSRVDTANPRRLVRLIESGGVPPSRSNMRPNTYIFGLTPDRETLERRVAHRVENMLAMGLAAEVKELSMRYGWDVEPMKSVGYREWRAYIAGEANLAETTARIVAATMQLAKKQRTWFRRNNSIHWVYDPEEAVDIATTLLNK